MGKVIIGIHGLSNKPPRDLHREGWIKAIREGLAKNGNLVDAQFDFVDVYWADLMYRYPLHQDVNFRSDALYDTEPYVEAAPGALREYKDKWVDSMRADLLSVVGSAADAVKGAFGFDRFADAILERHLKDLGEYYSPQRQIRDRTGAIRPVRDVLRDELKNAILQCRDREILLIAHSMGTIIAYDVLRDLGRQPGSPTVPFLLTIGSPLGLPHVKLKIQGERSYDPHEPVRTPSLVTKSWWNCADRKDVVAVDTHLADDYGPNATGVQVVDDLILNDYVNPEGKPNHHKHFGYLRAPEVSGYIRDFLR